MLGLASGFAQLRDGDEEYLFLANEGEEHWLEPHLGGPARLLRVGQPPRISARARAAASYPALASAYGSLHDLVLPPRLPGSDGTLERAEVDLVHFTFQDAFLTGIPSIYQPHDLQHVHLPRFFTRRQRRYRERAYRAYCEQAARVVVSSTWVKNDVVRHLSLAPEKVQVVPLAPIVEHYAEPSPEALSAIRRKFALPERFALYPAQTWPHKNHKALLDALARVRDRHGVVAPLVCSGRVTDFGAEICAHARRLGLDSALQLVGFVSPDELQGLYRMARAVVIPTLFEAASFPLWEAFQNGVPAACSNVTSLPEQAGDAALVFDPRNPDAIAEAIFALWTDEPLRQRLVARARTRVASFTWERTARLFRAHYRSVAARRCTPEDAALLGAAPAL